VVDVVFQAGIEDELREEEDELKRLGDDVRVFGFLMVVAMMLNPITAALYLSRLSPSDRPEALSRCSLAALSRRQAPG
jgi:hypothetical protein